MKSIITCLLLAIAATCKAQEPQELKFSRIIHSPDSTTPASELYNKCVAWISTNYNSGKAVTDLDAKEQGIIVAKPMLSYSWAYLGFTRESRLYFIMKISIKEGKIKLDTWNYHLFHYYDGSEHDSGAILSDSKGPATSLKKEWNKAKDAAGIDFENTCKGIQKAITEKEINW